MPDEKHIKPFQAVFNKLGYCTSIISDENAVQTAAPWMQQQFGQHAELNAHDSVRICTFLFLFVYAPNATISS